MPSRRCSPRRACISNVGMPLLDDMTEWVVLQERAYVPEQLTQSNLVVVGKRSHGTGGAGPGLWGLAPEQLRKTPDLQPG